jgi:hypothetical protein
MKNKIVKIEQNPKDSPSKIAINADTRIYMWGPDKAPWFPYNDKPNTSQTKTPMGRTHSLPALALANAPHNMTQSSLGMRNEMTSINPLGESFNDRHVFSSRQKSFWKPI